MVGVGTRSRAMGSLLAFVAACSTPSESNCGAGTEADACAGSSSGSSSTSVGMTTFASGAADTTTPGTTVGSASGEGTTAASSPDSSGGGDGSSTSAPTQGTGEGEASGATGEPVTCPNGAIDDGEQCDGTELGGNDCVSLGFAGGALSCAADCTLDPSACEAVASCGNGVLDEGEQCDGADLGGAGCEAAGDQYGGGTLGCNANCSFDTASCCVGFGSSCAVHECCGDLLFCGLLTGLCL